MQLFLDDCENVDRLMLFLSSETFVGQWERIGGRRFASSEVVDVQRAARAAVVDFMGAESVFWEIDFSSTRIERTKRLFFLACTQLGRDTQATLAALIASFCVSQKELRNVEWTVGFLHRVARRSERLTISAASEEPSDIIAACLDPAQPLFADLESLRTEWLGSAGQWDCYVRHLTPDLPDFVFLDLAENLNERFVLPLFVSNARILLGEDGAERFLKQLAKAIAAAFPPGLELSVPRTLITAGDASDTGADHLQGHA